MEDRASQHSRRSRVLAPESWGCTSVADPTISGLPSITSLQDLASRREQLIEARKAIARVPCRELFELSGRPLVAYEVRDYHNPDGRRLARFDLPFLFKAFETGQPAPPRAGTKNAAKPRAATIHEYLDWTVTAEEPKRPIDLVSPSAEEFHLLRMGLGW